MFMNLSPAKCFAKVGLVLVSIIIGFGICEILSRIIYKIELPYFVDMHGKREQLLIPDNELDHRTRPNFDGWLVGTEFKNRIQTNSNGFRDRQTFSPNKNGKLRIMALGDSFTFGFGVEEDEVFIKKIAENLQNSLSTQVETLNLGVLSYGTLQELRLFHKYKYLKPDFVVLKFFDSNAFAEEGGNDLVDNYKFFYKYVKGKLNQKENYLSFTRRARSFLKNSSNLYRWVELYFGGYLRKKYSPERENIELKNEAWQITADCLMEFDRELQNQNIKSFLIWTPFPSTVVNQDHSVAKNIAALRLRNIILVDSLEALGSNPMNYYYRLDSHWNSKGHDLGAKLISEKIIESGILSKRNAAFEKK